MTGGFACCHKNVHCGRGEQGDFGQGRPMDFSGGDCWCEHNGLNEGRAFLEVTLAEPPDITLQWTADSQHGAMSQSRETMLYMHVVCCRCYTMYVNQSINQSINQSNNQSINESINQSDHHIVLWVLSRDRNNAKLVLDGLKSIGIIIVLASLLF